MNVQLEQINNLFQLSPIAAHEVEANWPISTLEAMSRQTCTQRRETLITQLEAWELPEGTLPFCEERRPFQGLHEETMAAVFEHALRFPEQDGRLVNAARSLLGVQPKRPNEFMLVEAHIDISDVNAPLRNSLIQIGFQPDDFFKLEPACYTRHFTLAFRVPRNNKDRFRRLKHVVEDKVDQAIAVIGSQSDYYAFIEWEVFSSNWVRKYSPFRAVDDAGLEHFPFDRDSFRVQSVPSTQQEASEVGIALDSRKRADVHVKLPTEVRRSSFPDADTEPMRKLRDALLRAHFYEIVSEAGNAIYTGQFLRVSEAVTVFRQLDTFCNRFGGFIDLVAEVCVGFWRQSRPVNGTSELAEVSNLLIPTQRVTS